MLILTRKLGESITIGDTIKLTVLGINGRQVRLGIDADKQKDKIHREPLCMICCDKALIKFPLGPKILPKNLVLGFCPDCQKIFLVNPKKEKRVEASTILCSQLHELIGLEPSTIDRKAIKEIIGRDWWVIMIAAEKLKDQVQPYIRELT